MKKALNYLRRRPKLYGKLRDLYGYTIGLWPIKTLYLNLIGFYNGKKRLKLLSKKKAEKIISKKIVSGKPFMLARYGSNEFRNLFEKGEFNVLCSNAGFFPNEKKFLKKFREIYIQSSKKIDFLAVMNYKMHFLKKRKLLRNLPNIKYITPTINITGPGKKWLKSLKNKKILIIHPFKATIEKQMGKRKELKILPKLKNFQIIKAVQTIAGNPDPRFKTWFEALDYMKKEIGKRKDSFDIAIIGCGAYGLPLAAHVKSIGKQGLHLAGSTQLLFGIKGKRWENSKEIKFNKYWINPLEEDKPKNPERIEGGAYW